MDGINSRLVTSRAVRKNLKKNQWRLSKHKLEREIKTQVDEMCDKHIMIELFEN